MKKTILFLFLSVGMLLGAQAQQDKSKRPSPPGTTSATTAGGTTINIHYSRPYLKGRPLQDLVPPGKIWRTGANEATTFEVNKEVTIAGKKLPAGKYALFTIPGESESTVIFNKVWEQWGTGKYNEAEDALRITVPTEKSSKFTEQFTITAEKSGRVTLLWGDWQLAFQVK